MPYHGSVKSKRDNCKHNILREIQPKPWTPERADRGRMRGVYRNTSRNGVQEDVKIACLSMLGDNQPNQGVKVDATYWKDVDQKQRAVTTPTGQGRTSQVQLLQNKY